MRGTTASLMVSLGCPEAGIGVPGAGAGPQGNVPALSGHNLVFVVGSARSGTTWLQRLLASHPRVHTGQESFLFTDYVCPPLESWRRHAGMVGQRREKGLPCYMTQDQFLHIAKLNLAQLLQPMIGSLQAGELFLEKTPMHAECMADIVLFLPRARFIHLLRDPRDVVASLLAASRSWGSSWGPKKARYAARWWRRDAGAAYEAGRKLPSWQFLQVRYEDLSADTEGQLRRCADFLGLAWDRTQIAQAISSNTSAATRAGGGTPIALRGEAARVLGDTVNEPEGFVRKAEVGSWKRDLTTWQKLETWLVAHELMSELGYAWPAFAPLSALVGWMIRWRKRLRREESLAT
jgi:hypothetical protein